MRGYRLVAVAFINKTPMYGYNSLKTDPKYVKHSEGCSFSSSHAEMRAMAKFKRHLRKKIVLYVVRVNNRGQFTLSRPCEKCQEKIEELGISFKNVWYTDYSGRWNCLGV